MFETDVQKNNELMISDRDQLLRLVRGDDTLISIETAVLRCFSQAESGKVLKEVGIHFGNLINDIKDGMELEDVGEYYSFQDFLSDHYNNLLESNFEINRLNANLPHHAYANACYNTILDYAREMSIIGADGVRYTIGDITGVDVLPHKYDKYINSTTILIKYGMPEDVCEYLAKSGIEANREDVISEQLSDEMGE